MSAYQVALQRDIDGLIRVRQDLRAIARNYADSSFASRALHASIEVVELAWHEIERGLDEDKAEAAASGESQAYDKSAPGPPEHEAFMAACDLMWESYEGTGRPATDAELANHRDRCERLYAEWRETRA